MNEKAELVQRFGFKSDRFDSADNSGQRLVDLYLVSSAVLGSLCVLIHLGLMVTLCARLMLFPFHRGMNLGRERYIDMPKVEG